MRDKLTRFLGRMFYSRRVPSSIIFYGKEGIGKRDIAFELSKALLCIEEKYPSCGRCESCVHMMSFDKRKDEELRFYGEDKRGKSVYLYMRGDHPDFVYLAPERSEIKIDQIRGVRDFIYLSPALSKRKVVLIEPADSMNPYAQNALLKVLEEPPQDTHFLLVSNNLQRILPTVRSRSFVIEVPPLTKEELKKLTKIEDPVILELAEGSVKMAKRLKEDRELINTAELILEGKVLDLYKKALEVEKWEQERQYYLLRLLQSIYHRKFIETENYRYRQYLDIVTFGLEYLNKGIRISLLLFQLIGGDEHVLHKSKISGYQ